MRWTGSNVEYSVYVVVVMERVVFFVSSLRLQHISLSESDHLEQSDPEDENLHQLTFEEFYRWKLGSRGRMFQ